MDIKKLPYWSLTCTLLNVVHDKTSSYTSNSETFAW